MIGMEIEPGLEVLWIEVEGSAEGLGSLSRPPFESIPLAQEVPCLRFGGEEVSGVSEDVPRRLGIVDFESSLCPSQDVRGSGESTTIEVRREAREGFVPFSVEPQQLCLRKGHIESLRSQEVCQHVKGALGS